MTPQDVADQLHGIASEQDFAAASSDLAEAWSADGVGIETVEPILRFIENHPTIDYGMPGPLVHFLERFYRHGYEERLLDSLQRSPMAVTVWMLNRIINVTTESESRLRLIAAMRAAGANPAADDSARQMADRFLKRLGN